MKILFYNHTGQVSGAERVLVMILSRLDRDVFDPVVVCPEQGPLQEMAKDLGVKVETVAGLDARFTWRVDTLARYCKSFFGVIRQLRRRVVDNKPDLLHANSIRSGLVATAATFGLGTRVVWHLHDLLPRHPLSIAIRTFAALSKRTRMIAVSEAVAKNFRGSWSSLLKDRVSVILNSIDLDRFQLDETSKRAIRKELRFRETDLAIGIVGQLTPRKGQLELLRAFGRALAEVPNSLLVVVGAPMFNRDHEYLELLKRTAAELGIGNKVRMLGARDDIAAIMQGLDLLVVNSSAEPFGLVILEAMACGTPVLATAVDGIPEIIKHNENGWLVPPLDEAALTEGIVYLGRAPELRARLAKRGKQRVTARFAVGRYITELQTCYRSRTNAYLRATAMESTDRQVEPA
ncbi:MAG: glycosyltransferase family 4 protein [Pyrinomonadaceae bacterium]